eukprot:3445772-Alexandrium_andersonii.AAC.1
MARLGAGGWSQRPGFTYFLQSTRFVVQEAPGDSAGAWSGRPGSLLLSPANSCCVAIAPGPSPPPSGALRRLGWSLMEATR